MKNFHLPLVGNQDIILISGTRSQFILFAAFLDLNVYVYKNTFLNLTEEYSPDSLSPLRNTWLHVGHNRNNFNPIFSYFVNCKLSLHNFSVRKESFYFSVTLKQVLNGKN